MASSSQGYHKLRKTASAFLNGLQQFEAYIHVQDVRVYEVHENQALSKTIDLHALSIEKEPMIIT